MSFYYGATLPDPTKRLSGTGSQNRFIRLPAATTVAEPDVEALIHDVEALIHAALA
jgi:hypothetical protein